MNVRTTVNIKYSRIRIIKTEFEIGKNLNHVYPAFPIPEATKAISKIVEFVKSK